MHIEKKTLPDDYSKTPPLAYMYSLTTFECIPLLPFAPPSGAVAVVVERGDAAEELGEENALFLCKSIAPTATEMPEMPRLDRKGGRRKAKEENSLEAGNGVVENDAVLRGWERG